LLATRETTLITPYGGNLVNLMAPVEYVEELKAYASSLPSVQISPRSICDLEMLATGAFSPLDRFMGKEDYKSVVSDMRLVDGSLFPMPITLSVSDQVDLHLDRDIAIRNSEFELMAIMTVEEIYEWDREKFALHIYGSQRSPNSLRTEFRYSTPLNISGRLRVLQLPRHYEFQRLWLTPYQTRFNLAKLPYQEVIAIHPDSTLLSNLGDIKFHEIEDIGGTILLQLAVGTPKTGDHDYYNRVRIYRDLAEKYLEPTRYILSLLPLSLNQPNLRESLQQVLIQRNFGASYTYIDSKQLNQANLGAYKKDYDPTDAYNIVLKYSHELGMKTLPLVTEGTREKVRSNGNHNFLRDVNNSQITTLVQEKADHSHSWQSFQRGIEGKFAKSQPPTNEKGVCIWFTGLSGSGKSTTAEILSWSLMDYGRKVTVLDGDVVRTNLSKGLGFSKEDRDTNVRRIGFVASELVRLGGVVICAVVSPYRDSRDDVRDMMGKNQFIEVYVNTPLEICEGRDVKGFYAKARRNEIKGFTGIDDPYEPPEHPEITLDTITFTPQDNAKFIVNYLIELGLLKNGKS